MPSLPKNLAAIRNAIASILRSAGHVGHLYSASDIATILRITADVDNNEAVGIDVDSHLVVRAFSFEQQNEYSLPYGNYFGYAGDNHVLYHRMSGQEAWRARRIIAIGCFSSISEAHDASTVRWNAGLDQLEKYHLTQCLVNKTKKKESRKSRADTPPSNMIEETVETSPSENICPAQNVKLRYILDGLAGELEIDVRHTKQISVDILVSNLKQDEQDKNTETKRKRMQYERRRINDVFVWLPVGVSRNM